MQQSKKFIIAKVSFFVVLVPLLLLAHSFGPDPQLSGAPGDANCTACHGGTPNSGPGNVALSYAGGTTYTPGQKQRLTVTVTDNAARRWGFQVSARLASDERNAQAGTFTGTDANVWIQCASGSERPAAGCSGNGIEWVQQTSAGTQRGATGSGTWSFDWTPPATDRGPVNLYVAGNAANGDGSSSGDRIYTSRLTLTPAAAQTNLPTIADSGVVNAASGQPGIVPGSWTTIRGTNLAPPASTRIWRDNEIVNGQLPTVLDGVRVTVNNRPAFVYFISPAQINFLAPSDTATGPVEVEVQVENVGRVKQTAQIVAAQPAFFPWPGNFAVATSQDFQLRVKNGTFPGATTTPAKPGDVLILWGTGFGATNPAITAGTATIPANATANSVVIRIRDVQAETFGAAMGSPGLYQVAIRLPASLPDGDHPITATINGVTSPSTTLLTVQR